jgi:dienelactone hydrolase
MKIKNRPSRVRRTAAAALSVLAIGIPAPAAGAPVAADPANPYERGPAPTVAALEAEQGPFAVAQTTVAAGDVSGFGGATIFAPTDTSQGTFGGIAVAPGYLVPGSTLSWLSARVASHGFVVIAIDTLREGDGPSQRARQLQAALTHLTARSTVRDRVDASRLGVMGHSMGGGGAIEAAADRPDLLAAVPLTPWHTVKSWPRLRVPTLVLGAERDTTAPPASHAEPFYDGMTAAREKAYLELADEDHRAPIRPNTTIGLHAVAWLKRFVDGDLRYEQFLCPRPAVEAAAILEYRDTCPHA